MEQALYWMHTKRKHILNSHIQSSTTKIPSYGDSWEEQAFAEDAAGPLGGCVWPPRSYSCSFCKREFRSAQALGGHMNVHRRDRARLKQSPNPHTTEIQIPHLHHQNHHTILPNSCSSLDVQYPSQICILDYNPNPSSDHCVLASTSSPSRVSAPTLVDNCSDQNNFVLPFSSPNFLENHKGNSLSSPPSCSNLVAKRCFQISDSENGDKNSKQESGHRATGDYVKADSPVSLNLVVCRALPIISGTARDEAMSCKRRRTNTIPLSLLLKPAGSVDRQHSKSEVLEFSPSSIEDLDLELRLGDRPKVK